MDETTTRFDRGADLQQREIVALRAEVARLRRIEAVALEFCARCERGEIRSTNTYLRFLTALRPPDATPPERRAGDELRPAGL
jgi:hypothetical protein